MRVILRPMDNKRSVVKYRNCFDYIGPYFTRSGNIYTGINEEDSLRLGAILGLNLLPSSSFWNTFSVRIGAGDVYIDTEDPLDEIKYLFLKNHKRVKTSIFENKATADYLLINKEEEAKKENLFNKAKVDAISEYRRMSLTDMRKCLRLFGHNAENSSGELVENELFKIIENNPNAFLDKWVNNRNRELEVIIEKAIAKNIIRRNKNVYKFGSEAIAYNMQECIDYLNNPKNQDVKLSILSAIDAKDYIVEGDAPEKDLKSFEESEPKTKKKVKPSILSGPPGSEDEEGIDISKNNF